MRLLDVLLHTQAHCAVLSASQASTGRTSDHVAAMARYGFVRPDFAEWFEESFGGAELCHKSALAGLLIAFGLGVHTVMCSKMIALSPCLSRLLKEWSDPVNTSLLATQKLLLTPQGPIDISNAMPVKLGAKQLVHSEPLDFLGVYLDSDTESEFIDSALKRMPSKLATVLIVSAVKVERYQETLERHFGQPMSFVACLEGAELDICYYSGI